MEYASQLLDNAVEQIAKLPGIGRKTALRLALHMLRQPPKQSHDLSKALTSLVDDIKRCVKCNNLSDTETCSICANPKRDHSVVCVVEDIRDVIAIENTQSYKGLYHVLGAVISPMEGIGPQDLEIKLLLERIASGEVKEVIFALSPTMEGDTTAFYLYKLLGKAEVNVSSIARGVSVGDELQFADEVTLGRSIQNRIPYQKAIKNI